MTPTTKPITFPQYLLVLLLTPLLGLGTSLATNYFSAKPVLESEIKGPNGQALIAKQTVPAGTIIAWYAKAGSIPDGWAVCDGTNGTPDLRKKYIRGGASLAENGKEEGQGDGEVHISATTVPLTVGDKNSTVMKVDGKPVATDPNTPAPSVVNAFGVFPDTILPLTKVPASVSITFLMKK